MKYLVLVLLMSYCMGVKSQPNQKVVYKGGLLYYNEDVWTQDGHGKPWGKSVSLVYDAFFKNYTLSYKDSKGKRCVIEFQYSKGTDRDAIYTNEGVSYQIKTMDDAEPFYVVYIKALPEYHPRPELVLENLTKR